MYLDELNDAAKRLLDAAKNPDVTTEDVQAALFAAKITLEKLPYRRDFLEDLDKLDHYAKESLAEYKKLLSTYEGFLVFFRTDQELLISKGIPRDVVLALETEAKTLWEAVRGQKVSKEAVLISIARLREQIDNASRILKHVASDQQAALRGSQGLIGVSAIGINLKFMPFEIAIPGGSILASGGLGLWLLTNSASNEPIFDRLARHFRRRG